MNSSKLIQIVKVILITCIFLVCIGSGCGGGKEHYNFEVIDIKNQELIFGTDSVQLNLDINIPPNYKMSKTLIEIKPVFIDCDSLEIEFEKLMIQGEKVPYQYTMIPYLSGGVINYEEVLPYQGKCSDGMVIIRVHFFPYKRANSGLYLDHRLAELKIITN